VKPLAIIPCYNEADIIGWVTKHILEQGCEVHVLDNCSTDGSASVARLTGYGVSTSRWPREKQEQTSWADTLKRVADIARCHNGRVLFHDADEVRHTDIPGETLAEGFRRVEAAGYNAIDHKLFTFPPVDNGYNGDPEKYFALHDQEWPGSGLRQVKAWRSSGQLVNLHDTGGHNVQFDGVRVYPEKWIMKHYPLRSQEHAERKVFRERSGRWVEDERKSGWHHHYGRYKPGDSFLADPTTLKRYP